MDNKQQLENGIDKVVEYLKGGARQRQDFLLGFELEQVLTYADGSAVPYSGERGVQTLLKKLASYYESKLFAREDDPTSPLIGLTGKDGTITLEPGGQLEFSSAPFFSLHDLRQAWVTFDINVTETGKLLGIKCHQVGYQCKTKAADIELLPKERYKIMDRYFRSSGSLGINMMRGSASTQVAIDFRDEADAIDKMRVAAAYGPLLALLTDNCPSFEGKKPSSHLTRTHIWNNVDPARCMVPPGLFHPGYSFAEYAKTVLTAPLILVTGENGSVPVGQQSATDCYDMDALSEKDIAHILSMFFFDVRLHPYVEIRVADSLPADYAMAYVALIKGLFYDEDNLAELSESVSGFGDGCVPAIKSALIASGYEADISSSYQARSVQTVLMDLLECARRALVSLGGQREAAYLDIFDDLVQQKRTLAQLC